jgi:hypothetical protein
VNKFQTWDSVVLIIFMHFPSIIIIAWKLHLCMSTCFIMPFYYNCKQVCTAQDEYENVLCFLFQRKIFKIVKWKEFIWNCCVLMCGVVCKWCSALFWNFASLPFQFFPIYWIHIFGQRVRKCHFLNDVIYERLLCILGFRIKSWMCRDC